MSLSSWRRSKPSPRNGAVTSARGRVPIGTRTSWPTLTGVSCSDVTVGVDIGTTSVKAVAVDADGTIVARSRIPHRLRVPAPDRMEHNANRAWRNGPARALAALGDVEPRGVGLAAMVP